MSGSKNGELTGGLAPDSRDKHEAWINGSTVGPVDPSDVGPWGRFLNG